MLNQKIKRIIAMVLVIILTVSLAACGNAADGTALTDTDKTSQEAGTANTAYQSIFEKDDVIDIKIEIAVEDWKSILNDPLAEEYKSADITVDGVKVENAGFRTKGNLTLRSVANSESDRFSFRIKLDEYVEDQNLLGLDEFVVNNMYADPSYMREYLSYEAMKELGLKVPENVYANIYINGELYGFYLCVEAIDDSFLESNFGNKDGNLYKQEQGSTLQYAEGSNYDSSEQKTGADESKTDLKNLIKLLNQMPEGQKGDIEQVLDIDSALKYIAANTVLGNYDSYSGNLAQNYYLYGQNGRFTVIPWDFNMSMAGFGGGGSAVTIPIDEPVTGINITSLPMIDNLLEVEEYKEKYHEYIKEYLGYLEGFEARVAELAKIIKPYIEADPSKFYTIAQFEAASTYSENAASAATNVPAVNSNNANTGNQPMQAPPDRTIDTAAGASQNINTPPGQPGQMPVGAPGGFQNGDRPQPPQGGMGGNMRDGGGMMNGATSIVNFIRERVANIAKQLAGELPTTGNTTMNSNMGGNRNNRQ